MRMLSLLHSLGPTLDALDSVATNGRFEFFFGEHGSVGAEVVLHRGVHALI